MNNKIYKDNKGFSLVELIVAVLITGILMLAVGLFMSTTRNTYSIVGTSAKLQEESLTAEKVISEFLKEAKAYGIKSNLGRTVTGFSGDQDLLWIVAKNYLNPSEDSCYLFVLEKPSDGTPGKLRFNQAPASIVNLSTKVISEADLTTYVDNQMINNKYKLVANCMVSMEDKSGFTDSETGKDLILLTCTYKYNNTVFTSNVSAVSRNIKK